MRASSRNHTRTGRGARLDLATSATHSTQNINIARRLDMQTPATPPTKQTGNMHSGEMPELPTTPSTSHPAKFGASPRAPSFASVVSSSTMLRGSVKSPLSPTRDAHLQSPPQKQEQAHTQEQPAAAHRQPFQEQLSTTAIDQSGSPTICDILSTGPAIAGGAGETQSERAQPASPEQRADHGSPNKFREGTSRAEIGEDYNQDNELEDSESSDVEIYLTSLELHDSASRMHVLSGHGDITVAPIRGNSITLTQPKDNSSVIPPTMQYAGDFAARSTTISTAPSAFRLGGTDQNSSKSLSPLSFSIRSSSTSPSSSSHLRPLQLQQYCVNSPVCTSKPSQPAYGTIPLPHVDDQEYPEEVDARQLQNLQQHQNTYQDQLLLLQQTYLQPSFDAQTTVHNDIIDLTVISGAIGNDSARGQQQFGLPTSQSLPSLTVDPPYNGNGFDNMTAGPASSIPASVSVDSGLSDANQDWLKNVYINGLPPHFGDDRLTALAAPYGKVKSVRTFTRRVRDSESGYGFVLYTTIEAAERCIVALRRYRNLHPTLSKTNHKILRVNQPVMVPSSTPTISNEQGPGSDSESSGTFNADYSSQEASFKAKMEEAQDPDNKNLYMEGLPLSITIETLSALVAPHVISSHKFFETRLSNPPRIIAFARLETRRGAEEVIERLHGRMVRGWNDTGSRISVRFADTAKQRELRRAERSAQEGDTSPSRLTMAQAALLNLHGKELGPETGGRLPPSISRGFSPSDSAPDFASNRRLAELEVDYSLAPGRVTNAISRSRSPYQTQHGLGYQQSDFYSATQAQLGYGLSHSPGAPMDPAMAALINSLGNANLSSPGAGGYGEVMQLGADVDYMQAQGSYGHMHPPVGHHHLTTSQSADSVHQFSRLAPVYTRSGYTPTEEYIMRAHAESLAHAQAQQAAERRRPAPLDLRRRRSGESEFSPGNIAVGVRGYRAQAAVGRLGQGLLSPTNPIGTIPSPHNMGMGGMADDEYHASMRNDFSRALNSNTGEGDMNRTVGSATEARHNPNIHPAHVNARLARDQVPASAPSTVQGYSHMQRSSQGMSPMLPSAPHVNSPTNQESPNLNQTINYSHAASHMRSTTLPQHRTSSTRDGQQLAGARGHYQHNSMSMPAQNLRTPQHANVAAFNNVGGMDGGAGPGTIYEDGSMEDEHRQRQSPESQTNTVGSTTSNSAPAGQIMYGEMEMSSSTGSLISPTLTYGTQTPSTLSPATPFFGSFSSQGDMFDKGAHGGMEGQHQKKLNNSSTVGSTPLRSCEFHQSFFERCH